VSDPYDDNRNARIGRDMARSVQTGAGIVFLVIGVGSLIVAAFTHERLAFLLGIVAILFGLTRLLLPLLRGRR
jgi:uncharacterized membrane protein HdeD (DUF308 family)